MFLSKYHSVLFTSGTLSPLDIYTKLLGLTPVVREQIASPQYASFHQICPLFVTKGFDRVAISSQFTSRIDRLILHSYGKLLVELSRVVPDGIVCFFPSYSYMNLCLANWDEVDLLSPILAQKLIFIESQSTKETALAFQNYRLACHSGRGAVLMAVARGRLSEGLDFSNHLSRTVVVLGTPFLTTQPKPISERMKYLQAKLDIKEADFLTFDAMRVANQCIGRALRGKLDYAVVIYADKRFRLNDQKMARSLPQWIASALEKQHTDLSADQCLTITREFLMKMSYRFDSNFVVDEMQGKLLWTQEDVLKHELTPDA